MATAPVVQIAGTGAAAATHTTASFTPPANTRLFAFVAAYKLTVTVAVPTITDTGGLTWTSLAELYNSGFTSADMRATWFISSDVGSSPAARTVTVTTTGGNSIGVTVLSMLSSEISGSLVQFKTGEDPSAGDPTVTFSPAPVATNTVLLGVMAIGGNTFNASAGYTPLSNAAHSTARRHAVSYDIAAAATSPQYTSTNTRSLLIGLELAPPPTGRVGKVWNGSAWVTKPVKVWSGAAWVVKPVKIWSGSAWI